jgi:hypothetical protein
MQARHDQETLQLGDNVLIETSVDQVPLILRGKLSGLQTGVVWVNVAGQGFPPLVLELKEGHPVRLSAARGGSALVGDATFRSCLGMARRLIALSHPTELRLVDRRASLRVAIRKSIGIRLARNSAGGAGGHFAIGTSIDIGMVGIRFEAATHMAVGDHIFVTVVLEQNRQLYALAQIVRLEDAVAGEAVEIESPVDPSHPRGRLMRATAKWDAIAPGDRQRLESFLLSVERAAGA